MENFVNKLCVSVYLKTISLESHQIGDTRLRRNMIAKDVSVFTDISIIMYYIQCNEKHNSTEGGSCKEANYEAVMNINFVHSKSNAN